MRRFVSIVFLLLCSLGPLSALLPGSEESQLPACCRRHGAHHCTMAVAEQAGSGHVVSAPSRCPQYHRGSVKTAKVYTPSTALGDVLIDVVRKLEEQHWMLRSQLVG